MVWCCGTHSRRRGCAEFRCGPWLSTLLKHPMTSNRAAGWRMYASRRLAHWTRLYPEVRVDRAIAGGSACRHLAANAKPGQLFVADSHSAHELCGAYQPGCAVLTVRSANL